MNSSSRLKLPSVTLVAIDTFNPERTLHAMRFSMRQIDFAEAFLVCLPGFIPKAGWGAIQPHYAAITSDRLKRELFMLTRIHSVFSTTHCLHIEWDSSVANQNAWNEQWLEYDFIGAPWPWPYEEPGVAPCTAENCVGNTGFSLMSHALMENVSNLTNPTPTELKLSDAYMCRALRPQLDSLGMKFAPERIAALFSCENRIYAGQFGWHGRGTAARNGWNIDALLG